MKFYYYLLALCLTMPVYAQSKDGDAPIRRVNGLFKFIANQAGGREAALFRLIARRCNRYMFEVEKRPCRDAVQNQIELLDFDLIFTDENKTPPKDAWSADAFVFIAFKGTLIKLLSEPKTSVYLDKLRVGLSDYLTGANPKFNIWDMTLDHYKSPLLAAKTIAALLQDTSSVKLHLAYLERIRNRSAGLQLNIERLSKAIDSINLILDYSEDSFRTLFYPPGLREHLKWNIYHFYVPFYLSMALEHDGIPSQYAMVAPLMLTITYEFITSAPDYRYLMRDPERLDPVKHASTLRDIFACFSGSSYGIGKSINPGLYPVMTQNFSRSTHEGVEFLVYTAN